MAFQIFSFCHSYDIRSFTFLVSNWMEKAQSFKRCLLDYLGGGGGWQMEILKREMRLAQKETVQLYVI